MIADMSWRADQLDRFELDRFRGCEPDGDDDGATALLFQRRPAMSNIEQMQSNLDDIDRRVDAIIAERDQLRAECDELKARAAAAIRYTRCQKEAYCKVETHVYDRDTALREMERYGWCIATVLGKFGGGECAYLDEARKQIADARAAGGPR